MHFYASKYIFSHPCKNLNQKPVKPSQMSALFDVPAECSGEQSTTLQFGSLEVIGLVFKKIWSLKIIFK